ncbi:class I SAM-dependent methyltransferase [Flavobacteriaceae bacterium]|jgi:2-polyprenyl-3-methyl-5-hydroxy-6-metoxy-1,4-benzoquinol methylase|nr:class I SAM-dependent methyltransferase [Flavobacteriaceae bacterium]
MKKDPINVFGDWALSGRDERMAQGHSDSVKAMLGLVLSDKKKFSFLDVGCGNGWVVRKLNKHPQCQYTAGVDGSEHMIAKAKSIDETGNYYCQDIRQWTPYMTFDVVHSMEVLYYVEKPDVLIQNIFYSWLNSGGKFIMGIDFYHENTSCHSWQEDCGVTIMQLFPKNTWINFFKKAGFKNVSSYHLGLKEGWAGTLVVMGEK